MFLEIATTLGRAGRRGAGGATCRPAIVAVTFGVVLAASALSVGRPRRAATERPAARSAGHPPAAGRRYPGPDGPVAYHVRGVPGGFGLMFVAGALSGLLGIGSGALKVLAMDQVMRIPFKVSTTTSNFMIGVTAAASAGVYLNRGYIDPGLAMPVMLGVLPGALLGARLLADGADEVLADLFAVVDPRSRRRNDLPVASQGQSDMPESPNQSPRTEKRLEIVVGNLLRTGVLTAAAVVFLGGRSLLCAHGAEPRPDYKTFHGEPSDLRSVGRRRRRRVLWKGRGLIQLGLLL